MMLTFNQLFWERVRAYYRKQWNEFKLVIDWTIFIYLFIPFLLFIGINHYLWWQGAPAWSTYFSLMGFVFVLQLLFMNGHIQLFYKQADSVFLLSNSTWLHQLQVRGLYFSFWRDVGIVLIVVLYFLPLFFYRFHLSWMTMIFYGLIFLFTRQLVGYIYHFLNFILQGLLLSLVYWGMKLIFFLLVSYCMTHYQQSMGLVLLGWAEGFLLIGLVIARRRMNGKLLMDIQREELWYDRWSAFFVKQSGSTKKNLVRLRRPFIFRKSQSLFRKMNQVNGLSELMIKNRLRDGRALSFYLQITLYSTVAILRFPDGLKFIIFFGVTLLFAYWLKESLNGLMDHGFVKLFHVNDEIRWQALNKTHSHMLWVGLFIQMTALTMSVYGWGGFLVGCPLLYIYQKVLVKGMQFVR